MEQSEFSGLRLATATNEELVASVQQGHSEAFTEIFSRHQERIARFSAFKALLPKTSTTCWARCFAGRWRTSTASM